VKVTLLRGKSSVLNVTWRVCVAVVVVVVAMSRITDDPLAAPWESIPAMLAAAEGRFAETDAVRDGDTTLSYEALAGAARTFGAALVATGVGPGDRVALWCPNCAEWVVAMLGILAAGGVLVPVNTRFKGAEATEILARSGARLLATVTDFLDTDYVSMLAGTGAPLPALDTVVVVRGPLPRATGDDRTALSWEQFLGRATPDTVAEVARRSAALSPDDPSDILFTSGTTGVARGVVMTHGRTLVVATDWAAMSGLRAGDVYLQVNPYFHMFGLKAGILASVAAGATMLPEPVFDAGRVLERVAADRVTVLPGAPTVYGALLDHPARDHHDLSSLRVAVTGAADIPVELIRRVQSELPFSLVVTGYGLTEAGTACATSEADDAEAIATTVGRPRPGFEVRIVEGDREVETGGAGEILLRGGSVMACYLDDPVGTAAALSSDGWLRTGDLGVVDGAGRVRIVGRVKDMFIVGGFNAYPAEIENALLRHPAVRQAAVIGIPDERLGEVGMAFVVVSGDVTGDELISWSRGEMANYKVPRAVEVVDALPLNATGKVMKESLRARAQETRARGVAE
jgi:acyl-CoA synthetase (AMP-forming)/AMP-acid ligase II